MISVLVYVSIFEQTVDDPEYNAKRGMMACVLVFILLGVTVSACTNEERIVKCEDLVYFVVWHCRSYLMVLS